MRPCYTILLEMNGEWLAVGRFRSRANAFSYGQQQEDLGIATMHGVVREVSTQTFRFETTPKLD